MGQKIHPLGFRVGITRKHRSVWFSNPKQYPQSVLEDSVIRNTILQSFPSAEISEIHIQRTHHDIDVSPNGLVLIIYAKRPNQIVGNKNDKLQVLRTVLKQKLNKCRALNGQMYINSAWRNFSQVLLQKQKTDRIKFLIREITTPYSSAFCIGNEIVKQLQDRQRFRYVVKKVISEIKNEAKQRLGKADLGQPIKGVKIQLAGRLNGAEIARTEWFRKGRVPLHTLKADIDYSYQKAYTKYGIIGVKIWVFAGIKSTKPKLERTQFLNGYIYA